MCFSAVIGALCCFGSAFCGCCCKGLNACGIPAKNYPKAAYVVYDLLFMVISVILMYTFRPLFKDNDWLECNDASGGGHACFGTAAVLRASFILFLYHIMILVMLIPRGQCSSAVHDGWFTLKFLIMMISYIASFWMPNSFFSSWADFCRFGSIFYLILQGYFLLNFAYLWNDKLVQVATSTGSCYANFLLCGFSIILAIVCVVWFAFQFIWFSGCAIGNIVLAITVIFFVFFYIVSLLKLCDVDRFRPNATVFVVGFTTLYVVYLSWTALASHPYLECNDMIDSSTNTFFQIFIGAIFTTVNIWCIAIASSDDGAGKEKTSMGQGIIEEDNSEAKPTTVENEEKAFFPVTGQTMFFHGIMMLVSLYFGMLFTNWGYAVIDDELDDFSQNAFFSMWVKISAQWITILLFTISVTLYCCDPNRVI